MIWYPRNVNYLILGLPNANLYPTANTQPLIQLCAPLVRRTSLS